MVQNKIVYLVLTIVSLLSTIVTASQSVPDGRSPLLQDLPMGVEYVPGHSFSSINEAHPERFLNKLNGLSVPKGILLSVGFERAFIGASTYPKVDGLIILDFHHGVINSAEINVQLLKKLSESPANYSLVRSTKSEEVLNLAANNISPYDHLAFLVFHENSLRLWQHWFGPRGGLAPELKYWTDPVARKKITELALRDRIAARQVDLLDIDGRLTKVVKNLKEHDQRVALFDLSNVFEWLFSELGPENGALAMRSVVAELEQASAPDAILLFTRIDHQSGDDMFSYEAMPLKDIAKLNDADLLKTFAPAWKEIENQSRSFSYLGKKFCEKLLTPTNRQ